MASTHNALPINVLIFAKDIIIQEKSKESCIVQLGFLQIHFPVLLFDFAQLRLTIFMIIPGASGRLDMIEMYFLFGVFFHIVLGLTNTP